MINRETTFKTLSWWPGENAYIFLVNVTYFATVPCCLEAVAVISHRCGWHNLAQMEVETLQPNAELNSGATAIVSFFLWVACKKNVHTVNDWLKKISLNC